MRLFRANWSSTLAAFLIRISWWSIRRRLYCERLVRVHVDHLIISGTCEPDTHSIDVSPFWTPLKVGLQLMDPSKLNQYIDRVKKKRTRNNLGHEFFSLTINGNGSSFNQVPYLQNMDTGSCDSPCLTQTTSSTYSDVIPDTAATASFITPYQTNTLLIIVGWITSFMTY